MPLVRVLFGAVKKGLIGIKYVIMLYLEKYDVFVSDSYIFLSLICRSAFAQDLLRVSQIVVTGKVVVIKHPIALIRDSQGNFYHVRLGPYWFWKKQDFYLKVGEHEKIVAIQKGLLFFFIVISSKEFGVFRIRSECSQPLWSTHR
ncbi:hypothetical protein [Thermodesulfatator autotrophicus]|uniref:Uncharacterized protein n=1 Tax=Thermodesulfatator autotrophicus TaxID=1795632 RepID=A0A177E685_9BACT|nr:hypothetical protein [Thermodesulfatator autotrophicus]OAG27405.1 hypothetical protein TH606_06970 [Thermodesulfatator autotrophicus]